MKNSLGERLRIAMGHAGLNQKEAERRAKLSQGYTSRVLRGQRVHCDAVRLDRLASACGVDFEWLSTGKGVMLPRRGGGADDVDVAEPTAEERRGSDTMRSPAGRARTTEQNPLEDALAEAFRQGSFALTDLDAVRDLVRGGAAFLRDKEHLVDAARSWLLAAAALRKADTPVTFATLAWQMTTLGSARASVALDARDVALNDEARQELQNLGVERPPVAVRIPPRR